MQLPAHRFGDINDIQPFVELLKADPEKAWDEADSGAKVLLAAEYLGADMGLLNEVAMDIADLARKYREQLRDEVLGERALDSEHWHSHLVCGAGACTIAIGIAIHGKFHTYYYPATVAWNYVYAHTIAWSEPGTDIMLHRGKGTDLAEAETEKVARAKIEIYDLPGLRDPGKRRTAPL